MARRLLAVGRSIGSTTCCGHQAGGRPVLRPGRCSDTRGAHGRSIAPAFVRDLRLRDLDVAAVRRPGHQVRRAPRGVLRDAAGGLPPGRTDEDFVLGLLRDTGILCVYGSGFGLPAHDGFFRVVFLASPDELSGIYDDLAAFTARFLDSSGSH
jgi:hypothetical protein